MRMANAIIYSNANDNFYMDLSTNSFFTNSCLSSTNGLLGTGNLTNNPVFTDCALHNYRSSRGSPCINSGITRFWTGGGYDLDNRSRVDHFSGMIDMGCYEYNPRGLMFKVR